MAGLAAFLLRPLLGGAFPVSSDHAAHLFQAWDLWERRLSHGRLSAWSDSWWFGYPAGDLYHPGADLWVAGWRALSLGLLDWGPTYGLAFLAFFVFGGLALYRYGLRELGWLAALTGACLWLLDRGDYEQGGWLYMVRAGVWPQGLGLALFFFGLQRLGRALDQRRSVDHALAAALLGLGILAHPMNLVLVALLVPLLPLARWLGRRGMSRAAWVGLPAVLLLALGAAATWWLPLAARSSWTEAVGYPWLSLAEIGAGLWRGDLFGNVPRGVVYLGLLGGALGFARRRAGAILLALLATSLLLLAASDLGLDRLSEAFARFQFRRFTMPTKACLFLLAGFSLQSAWDGLRALARSPRVPSRAAHLLPGVAAVLAGLALALMLTHQAGGSLAAYDLPTDKQDPGWQSLQQVSAWLDQERQRREGHWRVAYEGPEHSQLFWAAPVYNGLPGYKPGFTCCRIFAGIPEGRSQQLYQALNIRYVVTQGPADRPGLERISSFSDLHLFRFLAWQPLRYTLRGAGQVQVLAFEPEHIQLRLSDTGGAARLLLHVAHYPRWSASLDGEPLEIDRWALRPGDPPFLMQIDAGDGLLELRYRRRPLDWLGNLLSLAALLALGLLALRRRRSLPGSVANQP